MTRKSFSVLLRASGSCSRRFPPCRITRLPSRHVDREITVRGVVTEVKWENPHTWIYVDAKDDSGKVVKWSFEGAVPNQLIRRGVTPSVLKPGVELTIKAHPSRDASRKPAR